MTGPPHLPFRPASRAAIDVARQLFAESTDSRTDDGTLVASAERICACVPDGLARWFGPYGSLALVTRALAIAEASNPALASVRVSSSPTPRLIGIDASTRTHGAAAMSEAIIALLATLHELLGRLIGEDMTLVLLAQCVAPPTSNGAVKGNDGQRVSRDAAGQAPGTEGAVDAHSTDEKLSQTMDEQ